MSRLRRFFDGNGKSPPKDAFQYRGWIYAYVFTTVCVSRYIFTTNRRSFANFIECELELLKRVFLPVINLSFGVDLRRIRRQTCASFALVRLPFVPRLDLERISSSNERWTFLYFRDLKNSCMILYCITNHFIIRNRKDSVINFHDFHFFNSCIFEI